MGILVGFDFRALTEPKRKKEKKKKKKRRTNTNLFGKTELREKIGTELCHYHINLTTKLRFNGVAPNGVLKLGYYSYQ